MLIHQTTPVIHGNHDCGNNIINTKPGHMSIDNDNMTNVTLQSSDHIRKQPLFTIKDYMINS